MIGLIPGNLKTNKEDSETQKIISGSDKSRVFESEDLINHPPHYNESKAQCSCGKRIECIDVTRHLGFNLGNVIKYLWRSDLKNGLEDLKKARWYLNDLINQLEKK